MGIRSKVFRKYLFFCSAAVLLTVLVLGVAAMGSSTAQLRQQESRICQVQLQQTCEYVEKQIESMESVSLSIRTRKEFHPFYIKQSVMNELQLIETFSQYSSYSPWIEEYYIWYLDNSKIYGTISSFDEKTFLRDKMGGATMENFADVLQRENQTSFLILPGRSDTLLMVMPFHFGTVRYPAGRCALIFAVKLAAIQQSISLPPPGSSTPFSLTYRGTELLAQGNMDETNGELITAASATGRIVMSVPADQIITGDTMERFTRLMVIIVALTLALGLAGAALAAYMSYKPVRALYKKYQPGKTAENEFYALNEFMENTVETARTAHSMVEKQLTEITRQKGELKRQLMLSLIYGENPEESLKQLGELGCPAPHELFGVCFLTHTEKRETFISGVESLSDEDCVIYSAEISSSGNLMILANFSDVQQWQDLPEMLQDLMGESEVESSMRISNVCTCPGDIPKAAIDALSRPASYPAQDFQQPQEDYSRKLEDMLEKGSTKTAMAMLDEILARIQGECRSYLMRMYSLNQLLQQLSSIARNKGIEMPNTTKDMLTDESLESTCRELTEEICRFNAAFTNRKLPEGGKAARYIRDNFADGNICLTSTAEALHVSTRQISRMLRDETDMTFKEYLLACRMEAAEKLLDQEGAVISDTAEKVGYFNVSHFIRSFKDYTGMTPGEWKRR